MAESSKELSQIYIASRFQHPAWQLLAARRGPLVLACLKSLFADTQDSLALEDALQLLAEMLAQHANDESFAIEGDDYVALANKELRDWIKRGLVVEREGRLTATDALQRAMDFVEGLENRPMTSTASRLGTVQREIEALETRLNPDPQSRVDYLRRKIKALEEELDRVNAGEFRVLEGKQAVESIRDVFNLATSLSADFRRVEDSYREADRRLRQSIISEHHHRGEIVESLLNSHDQLLETPEGQVFQGFYQQLNSSVELDNMKNRLRNILRNPATPQALSREQQQDLRWLVLRLVDESAKVIRARARSERDVKGFLKTGLAAEHHRVGGLLREIMEAALDIDWDNARERRSLVPLPPVGMAVSNLPLVERLRFKSLEEHGAEALTLTDQSGSLDDVEDEFWEAFDTLDRDALLADTLQLLTVTGRSMSIRELSEHLPPTHDLETLAFWVAMAREAELPIGADRETVVVMDREGRRLRFNVPRIALSAAAVETVKWDL